MTTWTEATPLNPSNYVLRDYVLEGYINDWLDPAETAATWTAATLSSTTWTETTPS